MTDESQEPDFPFPDGTSRHEGTPVDDDALRIELHQAMGRVRSALVRAGGSEEELASLSRRFAEHGLIVGTRHGRLDVPDPQVLSSPTANDWASRLLLYNIARQVAIDEELRYMLDPCADPGHDDGPHGGVPLSPAEWRSLVSGPLSAVDALWASTWRGVLRRSEDSHTLLRRVDRLLPAERARPVLPGAMGYDMLRRRIEEGNVAWDCHAARRPLFSVPGANPWLRTTSHASPSAACVADEPVAALARLWAWLCACSSRTIDRLCVTVAPAVLDFFWAAVTRMLSAHAATRTSGEPDQARLPTGALDLTALVTPEVKRPDVPTHATPAAAPPAAPGPKAAASPVGRRSEPAPTAREHGVGAHAVRRRPDAGRGVGATPVSLGATARSRSERGSGSAADVGEHRIATAVARTGLPPVSAMLTRLQAGKRG